MCQAVALNDYQKEVHHLLKISAPKNNVIIKPSESVSFPKVLERTNNLFQIFSSTQARTKDQNVYGVCFQNTQSKTKSWILLLLPAKTHFVDVKTEKCTCKSLVENFCFLESNYTLIMYKSKQLKTNIFTTRLMRQILRTEKFFPASVFWFQGDHCFALTRKLNEKITKDMVYNFHLTVMTKIFERHFRLSAETKITKKH